MSGVSVQRANGRSSLMDLGRAVGLRVAEGIEEQHELRALRDMDASLARASCSVGHKQRP